MSYMDGAKKKLNKEIHNKLASIGQSTMKFFFCHKGKMPPQLCLKTEISVCDIIYTRKSLT